MSENEDDLFGDDEDAAPEEDASKDVAKRSRIIDDDDDNKDISNHNDNNNYDNEDLFGDDDNNGYGTIYTRLYYRLVSRLITCLLVYFFVGIDDSAVDGFIVKNNLPIQKTKISSKLSLLPVDLLPNIAENMYPSFTHTYISHLLTYLSLLYIKVSESAELFKSTIESI